MRLERLTRGHVVAAVAALVLLLVMAMDWYGSHQADQARQIESGALTTGAEGGEVGRAVKQDAEVVISRDEKNAWQTGATIDRVLLFLLLATIASALASAVVRAQGRRFEPPLTPAALTAVATVMSGLLVAYRIIQKPGPDSATTVKAGPALAIIALAFVGMGAASAFQKEAEYAEMRRAVREAQPTS